MISVAGQPVYNKQKSSYGTVLKFPLDYTQAELTPKPKSLFTHFTNSLQSFVWQELESVPSTCQEEPFWQINHLITTNLYLTGHNFIVSVSPGRSASSAWGEWWESRVERKQSVKSSSLETRRTSWELRQSYFELDLHTKCCLPSLRTFQDNTDDKTRHPRFSTLWRFLFFLQQGRDMDPIDEA